MANPSGEGAAIFVDTSEHAIAAAARFAARATAGAATTTGGSAAYAATRFVANTALSGTTLAARTAVSGTSLLAETAIRTAIPTAATVATQTATSTATMATTIGASAATAAVIVAVPYVASLVGCAAQKSWSVLWNGYDPVITLVMDGDVSALAAYLEQYPQTNLNSYKTRDGANMVMLAVREEHRDMMAFLVGRGCSHTFVNASNGRSVVHEAALSGDLEMIILLMDKGITKNLRDHEGRVPLEYARTADVKAFLKEHKFGY